MRLLTDDLPPAPKPKSRLVPVATLVVLVLAAACWWFWGRAEPRPAAAPTVAGPAAAGLAAPGGGGLVVSANRPGAVVYLDGRRLGEAPQEVVDLAPGSHGVRVEKSGFPAFEQDVHVAPGHVTRIEARLKARHGLRVDSDVKGAQVFLDRRFVGRTPLVLGDVAAGRYRLNVSAPGHDMHVEELEIAGPETRVDVRFREVRLQEALSIVHKHGLGSCKGRLEASVDGLRYAPEKGDHGFTAALGALQVFQVDYLAKNLKVKTEGRVYNFTLRGEGADPLYAFHTKVDAARRRLLGR